MKATRCLLAIFAGGGLWAQTTVVVSGRITDANSGLPIDGAAVHILQGGKGGGGYVRFTDAGGTYSFGDAAPGTTSIGVSAPGYIPFEKTNPDDTTIQIAPDHAIHNFTLLPAASITGRVPGIDRDLPGAFMTATLLKEDFTEGVRHFAPGAGTAHVNADGEFHFSGLEPGRYIVRVAPDGSWTKPRDPKLPAKAPPTEGYTVAYYPGTSVLADALPISLAVGETFPVDFRVPTRPVWRASGDLDLPGAEGREATLTIYRRDDTFEAASLNGTGREVSPRQTMSAGVKIPGPFAVEGLPAGDYVGNLMVFERKTAQEAVSFFVSSDALAFTITDHDVEGMKLRPVNRQNLAVQGSFRMSNGTPLPAGLSVNFAYSQPGGELTAVAADGGTFWLSTPPGEYSLQPVVPPGYAVEALRYGGFNYLNSLIPMKGDTINSSLEIVLTDRPGAVAGDSRQPEARMVLVPDPVPAAFDFRSIRVTNADARGGFSFAGLTPGRYKVVALTGDDRKQDHDMSLLKDRLNKADAMEVGGR